MNKKGKKLLCVFNICLLIIVFIGVLLMFYSAANGDRYRFAQQGLKIVTYLSMVIATTSFYYRAIYRKKSTVKYCLLAVILILLMVGIFVINNILHYLGFASMFDYEVAVSLKQFCLDDVKYGVCRYISIPLLGITMFYVADKRIYRLVMPLFDRMENLCITVFSKLGLAQLCGLNDTEDEDDDER